MAKKKQNTRTGKPILRIVAVLLALMAIAYVITSLVLGVWNPLKWSRKNSAASGDDTSQDRIEIASYSLAAEDFAAYGISEQAVNAGVLTAEYTPLNTTNKRTSWTWRFEGNEWSTGKNVSDYVKFTAGTNYAPECTYEVLQPFGDTIIVEATSRANSQLKATTNIDYIVKYSDFWNGEDKVLEFGEEVNVFTDLVTEDACWTVEPTSYYANIKVTLAPEFDNWLSDNGYEAWNGSVENFEDVTGAVSLESLVGAGDASPSIFARYFFDTNKSMECYYFLVTAEITAYIGDKSAYTFTRSEGLWLSEACVTAWGTPPTNVTIPGGGQVIV